MATEVQEKIDLCGWAKFYGKWNNVFDKFKVLSTGLSWKQKYENKELKENKDGFWKKKIIKRALLGVSFSLPRHSIQAFGKDQGL